MFGFLLINKPENITSHDVIYKLRRALGIKKIGHAGTLDPMATGLMLIGVGKATRLLEYLVGHDKTYQAEITLGAVSNTYDAEGDIVRTLQCNIPTNNLIESEINKLIGKIKQIPPAFSAIKIKGQKAYDLARKGKKVTMKAREIEIYNIGIINIKYPVLNIEINCSSGTYIRSIAHDLGQELGCGGYLSNLKRTKIGRFKLEDACDLDQIDSSNVAEDGHPHLLNPLEILDQFPQYELNSTEVEDLKQGKLINYQKGNIVGVIHELPDHQLILGAFNNQLIVVLEYDFKTDLLKPRKVFA